MKADTIKTADDVMMATYTRFPVVMTKGKGARLFDSEGNEYLDFVSGLAVCNLGHCHPRVVEAINSQARKLMHVSNLFYTEPQVALAKLLVENTFADKVFFANSGAEANEAAIKLARKYSKDNFGPGRADIISMRSSFHGRTMATVSATGQEKFHKGFEPILEGFSYVPYDDINALRNAVTDTTCAILLEPIQGEGGVNMPSKGYLREVRELCNEKDLLLIFDEVQTGFFRTGTLFAYEDEGVIPDIMTAAKAMAGGISIGAALAIDSVAESFCPGTHASTFGGNPVSCAAGIAVMETMLEDGFGAHVKDMGDYLLEELACVARSKSVVKEVRGRGLIIGIELNTEGGAYVQQCLSKGVLINCANQTVLRLLPPLIITQNEAEKVINVIKEVL